MMYDDDVDDDNDADDDLDYDVDAPPKSCLFIVFSLSMWVSSFSQLVSTCVYFLYPFLFYVCVLSCIKYVYILLHSSSMFISLSYAIRTYAFFSEYMCSFLLLKYFSSVFSLCVCDRDHMSDARREVQNPSVWRGESKQRKRGWHWKPAYLSNPKKLNTTSTRYMQKLCSCLIKHTQNNKAGK